MDVEPLLLRAVHSNPADGVAWQALADSLEERGQAGPAELLRLRLALGEAPDLKKCRPLERRLQALLASGVCPAVPEVVNSVGMRLALVPPGAFWMGSAINEGGYKRDQHPRHRVRITRPFYLGVFPVTQAQYRAVMRTNPSGFRRGGEAGDLVAGMRTGDFPVERVSWHDAVSFCERLSAREKGRAYRLPTEAEWEYACRAGTSTPFAFGKSLSSTQANFDGKHPYAAPEGPSLGRPTPVGSYGPNAFGLYDTHGNVWEWCIDWYGERYYAESPEEDPPGPATGDYRVLRGGCWYWYGSDCRSAYRSPVDPGYRNYCVGFRVALAWGR